MLSIIGINRIGWKGVLAFFVGRIIGGTINTILGNIQTNQMFKESKLLITSAERNFINAYRLYASKLDKTTNIVVSNEELSEEKWKPVFYSFTMSYPELANRYTWD